MFMTAPHDAGNDAAIVGGANFYDVPVFVPAAIYEKTVRRNGRDRHLCHDYSAPQTLSRL
jgi:hypothetical protein